ncbi:MULTISPECIES: tyrosine-type recombinase/integrase [unclassified Maridesulfovibrio]|uniref:tyrosine-type recombinase/integrase n=1 Tax=unclassified Maridesulfovibrio TaxID=2794999 RepID=UPI003B3CE14A
MLDNSSNTLLCSWSYTGMRKDEIYRLQWQDIDFECGLIFNRDPKDGIDQRIPINIPTRNILKDQQNRTEKSVRTKHLFLHAG